MPGQQIIERSKEILGGTPVFKGTRVPVQTLFDYLEGGQNLDNFLEDFPTVKRSSATGVIKLFKELLLVNPS